MTFFSLFPLPPPTAKFTHTHTHTNQTHTHIPSSLPLAFTTAYPIITPPHPHASTSTLNTLNYKTLPATPNEKGEREEGEEREGRVVGVGWGLSICSTSRSIIFVTYFIFIFIFTFIPSYSKMRRINPKNSRAPKPATSNEPGFFITPPPPSLAPLRVPPRLSCRDGGSSSSSLALPPFRPRPVSRLD